MPPEPATERYLFCIKALILFDAISKLNLGEKEMHLIQQSYLCGGEEVYEQNRTARAVNGEVVSESESDDPEVYLMLSSIFTIDFLSETPLVIGCLVAKLMTIAPIFE